MDDQLTRPPAALTTPASRRRKYELRVGLLVIAGLLAALTALFLGMDVSILGTRRQLTTVVPNVGGLRQGDPVRLRGVNVGSVRGFRLVPAGVEVSMEVDRGFEIPVDSVIEVAPSSLLGEMRVSIMPGQSSQDLGRQASLPGRTQPGITGTVSQIAGEAGQALDRFGELLSPQAIADVHASSAALARAMGQLSALVAEQRQELGGLSQSLRRSAAGIERAQPGQKLEGILARTDSLASRMEATAEALSRSAGSAQAVLGRLEQGQGSLGMLTRDDTLYVNANDAVTKIGDAARQLAALAKDIRQNPKKYVKLSLF